MPSIAYCLPAKRRRNNHSRSKVNKNRKIVVGSIHLPIKLFSSPKIFPKVDDKFAVNAHLKDLRVQLIKLETIYDTFESYSASEVEMQTCNYIKLLKSSILNGGSQVSSQQIKKDKFRTVGSQLDQKAFVVANISELFKTPIDENITFDEILNACNKCNNNINTSRSYVEQTLNLSNKVSKSSSRSTSLRNVDSQTTTKISLLRNPKKTRSIKIEKVYDSSEDYSFSEVELQTQEYIDPLNSNSFNASAYEAIESHINEIGTEANCIDPKEPIKQQKSGLEALSSKASDHTRNEIECTPVRQDKKDSVGRDHCMVSKVEKINSVNLVHNSLKSPSKSNSKHAEFIPILDNNNSASKIVPLKDLRVQLIKLESISDDYENCSANKIELETHDKYFELLISSNFTCDPAINYQRPSGRDVNSIEKSVVSNCLGLKHEGTKILRSAHSPESVNISDVEDMPLNHRLPLERKKESKSLHISETLNASTHNQKRMSKGVFKKKNNGKKIPKMSPNTMVLIHEIKVECPICDRVFESEKFLKTHYEKCHKKNDNLVINPVRKYTNYRKKITSVKETNIVKIKWKSRYFEKSKCFICACTFETKESFFDHIKTHNPRKSQVCKKTKLQRSRSIEILLEDRTEEQQSENYKIEQKYWEERSVIELDLDNQNVLDDLSEQDVVSKQVQTADQEYKRTSAITKSIITCPCHTLKTNTQDLQIEIVFLCKICNIVYRQQDCFLMHFSSNPKCLQMRSNRKITRIPKIVCTKCPWLFDSLQKMRTHLEIHALQNYQGPITFSCRICKIVFSNIGNDFHQHWYNHVKFPNLMTSKYWFDSGNKELCNNTKTTKNRKKSLSVSEYSCSKCKLPFNFRPELEEHSQQACEKQRLVTRGIKKARINRRIIKMACSLCKKLYTGKERFDQHRRQCKFLMPPEVPFYRVFDCLTEQTFICCFCSELASSIDEINQHWQQVHSSLQELYTCKTCNIVPSSDPTIYTYQKFERHCLLKHNHEVVTCLVCFISAKYFCNICKLKFSDLELLRQHELFHEGT